MHVPACIHWCMHVCMYVCMHVCMYACMHACMYVCMHACMCVCVQLCGRSTHARMPTCMHYQSIYPSIHLLCIYPFVYLSIYLSFYLPKVTHSQAGKRLATRRRSMVDSPIIRSRTLDEESAVEGSLTVQAGAVARGLEAETRSLVAWVAVMALTLNFHTGTYCK